MASISTHLQKILSAVYGEEVRGSIHDAIAAMNVESSNAMQFASTAKDSAQASAISARNASDTAAQKAAEAAISANRALTAESEAETARDAAQKFKDAASNSAVAAAASAVSAQQYSGASPMPKNGTWWIWNADKQAYIDTKISCALAGPDGIGIADIQLTKGNHIPGTTDIYTVKLTDGTSYNISVYNGRNGTGAGDVLGIWFDLVIPAAGWVDGEITIADERFLALATHKYFLSADQASREEFLACNVQPKDIATTGFITFKSDSDPEEDLTVNVIRFELSANGTT